MNGELAQSIALVAHGNAFLGGLLADPPALERSNTAFRYVGSVEFRGDASFDGTARWFTWLREQGATRLRLVVPPSNPTLAGFANGLPSAVATGREDWVGNHTVNDQDAPDRRIWGVVYAPHDPVAPGEPPTLHDAADELGSVLDEASAFANANDELTGYGDLLRDARRELDAPAPRPAYHDDLLPDGGYDLRARQVVAAATHGWVFGGMGTWNDAGPAPGPRREEYDRLTRRFFEAVVRAIVAATNSFDPGTV
jgi:hypothetical protein